MFRQSLYTIALFLIGAARLYGDDVIYSTSIVDDLEDPYYRGSSSVSYHELVQPEEHSAIGDAEAGIIDGPEDDRNSILDGILPRSPVPLPLMKQLVEERDIVLPLPIGTSFLWTEMDRHVAVSDVRVAFGNAPPVSVERASVSETTFHASSQIGRVDLWVLPFANIYGVVGHTRSTGNVDVTINRFPFPFSPPVTIDVPVLLEGPTAGFGVTTGIGAKDWFATVDVNKTWTKFSQLDSALKALVVSPRVGLVIDRQYFKGEVHVGAMWQDTNQTVNLTIDHPLLGNGLHVQVDQYEPNPWNFLVGGLWAVDERIQLLVEGGTGGRSYVLSGLMVRY